MQRAVRLTRRRAFSLIELSIVFSLIGLVVGGVWYAASNASLNNTINQASDDLHLILANTRAYYAGQNSSFAQLNTNRALSAVPSATDFSFYANLLGAAGAFPVDMVPNAAAGNALLPNGLGAAQVALACTTGGAGCGEPVRVIVQYYNITNAAACTALVTGNGLPEQSTGLSAITINGAVLPTLPDSAADISNKCSGNGPFTIDWYFTMG